MAGDCSYSDPELHNLAMSIVAGSSQAEDQQRWNEFLNLLIQGRRLLAIGSENGSLAVFEATNDQGPLLVLPAFTSVETLRSAFPQYANSPQIRETHLAELMQVVQSVEPLPGAVINLGSNAQLLHRSLLQDMARFMESGHQQTTTQGGERMMLGDPKEFPHAFARDVAVTARNLPVKAMWLRQMYMNNELSYLVVVDCPAEQRDAIMPQLGRCAGMHSLKQPVDFVVLSPGTASYVEGCTPFYTAG